jgi:ABC-type transport system involved in cytochrome bd biosynthesis fused ATPase/permease subunit
VLAQHLLSNSLENSQYTKFPPFGGFFAFLVCVFENDSYIVYLNFSLFMIQLVHLSVSVNSKSILHDVSYTFEKGMITALLGHNGSGKSSLAFALAGHPRYHTTGNILLEGEDISSLSPTARYERGLFLSFQNIPEIP